MTTPLDHPVAAAMPIGTRLGEFELKRVLGAGGFGIVYLALDHALEREVAIKEYMPMTLATRTANHEVSLLSASHAESFALGLRSFVNEARLLARFDHPSLVKVHRYWEQHNTAYMAMPFYAGSNLQATRRHMRGSPGEAQVRAILDPLLGALEVLHEQGVYHRDISPDNIIVLPDGRPVLLDFGAARRVLVGNSVSLTAILKPAYAPIEQYGESKVLKQGPWTDLYALGATMHHLLLGRSPIAAPGRSVVDELLPLASQSLSDCSRTFLQCLDWMLKLRPADRPQSVAALRAALRACLVVAPVPPLAPLPLAADWLPTQMLAGDAQAMVLGPSPGRAPQASGAAAGATAIPAAGRPATGPQPVPHAAEAVDMPGLTRHAGARPSPNGRTEPTLFAGDSTLLNLDLSPPEMAAADRPGVGRAAPRAHPMALATGAGALALLAGAAIWLARAPIAAVPAAVAPAGASSGVLVGASPAALVPAPAAAAASVPIDLGPAQAMAPPSVAGAKATEPLAKTGLVQPVATNMSAVTPAPPVAMSRGPAPRQSLAAATAAPPPPALEPAEAPARSRLATSITRLPDAEPTAAATLAAAAGVAAAVSVVATVPAVAPAVTAAARPASPASAPAAQAAPPASLVASAPATQQSPPLRQPVATATRVQEREPEPAPALAPSRLLSPRERCDARVLAVYWACLERLCRVEPALREHADCQKLRRNP